MQQLRYQLVAYLLCLRPYKYQTRSHTLSYRYINEFKWLTYSLIVKNHVKSWWNHGEQRLPTNMINKQRMLKCMMIFKIGHLWIKHLRPQHRNFGGEYHSFPHVELFILHRLHLDYTYPLPAPLRGSWKVVERSLWFTKYRTPSVVYLISQPSGNGSSWIMLRIRSEAK